MSEAGGAVFIKNSKIQYLNYFMRIYLNVKPPIYQSHLLHTIMLGIVDP